MTLTRNARAFFLLALFFLSASPGLCGPPLTIQAEEQFGFAKNYFMGKEYFRAIGEFERFLYFFSGDPRAPEAMYGIGAAYFEGEKFPEARKAFADLTARFPESPQATAARFGSCACLGQEEGAHANISCLQGLANARGPAVLDEVCFRLGWAYAREGSWSEARESFARVGQDAREPFQVPLILSRLSEAGTIPQKNPRLAGALAIVPGLGHLYTGRYQDALISLVLNGALIFATVEAFDQDLPALGVATGLLGVGFYAGNIYSAVSSAHKANLAARQNFVHLLEEETRSGPESPEKTFGIGWRVPF